MKNGNQWIPEGLLHKVLSTYSKWIVFHQGDNFRSYGFPKAHYIKEKRAWVPGSKLLSSCQLLEEALTLKGKNQSTLDCVSQANNNVSSMLFR